MNPYTIFPDCEIQGGGKVAVAFRAMGIHRFVEACRHVYELPYGYNSDRDDPMILFKERFGSCTTKHATIASLAQELSLPISRGVGIYPMTEAIVTGAGRIMTAYGLPYVPMIHCYLEHQGMKVDLTEGNRNGKNRSIDEFLFTRLVEANISAKAEYLIYRQALMELVQTREELRDVDVKQLLHAREDGIKLLRANIGQEERMEIVRSPEENAVKRLLAESGLPTADIAAGHMEHFFGCGAPSGLAGVVGLELYGNAGLLRSLAVAAPERGRGLGKRLVAHAERYAQEHGVKEVYLLTTTAEAFFSRLGYRRVERDAVPDAIKATREYAGICPASSAVMTRKLSG